MPLGGLELPPTSFGTVQGVIGAVLQEADEVLEIT
jgi:hypothetical protein